MASSVDIIDSLISDLRSKISRINGYYTDVIEVKYGRYLGSSFNQRPAISFWVGNEPIISETLGSLELTLNVTLWAYADSEYDALKLGADLRKFLYSTDWTYSNATELGLEGIKYYGDPQETNQTGQTLLICPFVINFSENF